MEGRPLVSSGRGGESPGRLAGGARGISQGIPEKQGRGRDLHPSRVGARESRRLERGPAGAGGGSAGGSRETVRHPARVRARGGQSALDRKSTRLNSSHSQISYAVFCLKKKKPTGLPHLAPP